MQVTATTPIREHEKPMSWARAILIATGFFFLTAIINAQLPSYILVVSTGATLAAFEQGTLALGLIALGLGVICLEITLLYDPKPLLPWPLFAAVGAAITAVGAFFVYQVSVGLAGTSAFGGPGWNEYLPAQTGQHSYWPSGTSYLFNKYWFQPNSIDISAIGLIALVVGLGMFMFAVLNPFALRGKLVGPVPTLLVRFSLGLSIVIVALYLTVYTFKDKYPAPVPAGAGNIALFIALSLALFALLLWFLPVMVAHRSQFMPATYLHGVIGLAGNVAVPLLILWAVAYPLVNFVHGIDPKSTWVECGQKTNIPGSCAFTPFTGYIICAIVASMTLGLLLGGLYFWSTRRNTVVLGATIGLIYVGLAVMAIHVNDPRQTPFGLIVAIGITILAFIWTWSTQREFAPTSPQQLGCVGMWLVLGTLLLIFLFGFAFLSLPSFFEIEALALFYQPGKGGLHDAFWVLLLMGGFGALQFTMLIRRQPMTDLRKFGLWVLGIGTVAELIGAIQGFHTDVLSQGINAMQGSQAFFLTGGIFEVVGIATCLIGAYRARSLPWALVIGVSTLIGLAATIVLHTANYPELVVFAVIIAAVGSYAYTAAGPDWPPDEEAEYAANGANGGNGNGHAASSFTVTPR